MSSYLYLLAVIVAVIAWCVLDGMRSKEIMRFFAGGAIFVGLATIIGLAFRFT